MSWEQRNADFCAAQTDAQMAYIEAEREVDRLQTENEKLRKLVADMWREGMCECGSLGKCATCMYEYPTRMRELGIEVSDYGPF